MFGKFKEKLKEWANKVTKKEEEKLEATLPELGQSKEKAIQEEIDVESKADKKKAQKEEKKREEKKASKKEKIKEKAKKTEEKVEETIEEEQREKEIEMPLKFSPAEQKYEPDLEKLEETIKELDKESAIITTVKGDEITSVEVKKEKIVKESHEPLKLQEEKVEEKKGFFGRIKEKFSSKEKKEEIKEQEEIVKKEGLKVIEQKEKEGFFSKITSKITKVKISDKDFEEYEEDLKMLMLENNVAYEVVDSIIFKLKQKIVGKEILKKELETEIKDSLRDTIESILIEPFDLIDKITDKQEKPYVILFCGVNGTGKTTSIAKLAYMFQRKHLSCILAGADTFRAASIEQIKKHGEKLGIKVIAHDYGSDPASVGFDAISYAKKSKIDVVLIDTAGRMHTEKNLLKEIEKISRVCKPDTKIFVGEATTGNDSIEQIRAFDSAIGIDGIILTKADTDEKGGTSLSVGQVTRKPILYLGTGQEYDKLELFNKKKFTENLGL